MSLEPDAQTTAQLSAKALHAGDRSREALGITIDGIAPGRAMARVRVTDTMVNGHGIGHGGYLFLLADTAFAYACNTYGTATVAQGAQITFLRPAAVGDELVAEAVERSRYGRNGIYDVTVSNADGEAFAEFRGHSHQLPGLPDPQSSPDHD
ncbi:MAG TPA: hydroxyphenylacetyl-CoA thioesterase PaaI [Streptosporangiaceae bacterium]|nr:hydroxyphenylacetyl-CoA thioesterase PaaI [Streptosporangiaceae bacterium]